MKKLSLGLLALFVLFSGIVHAWKEPAWTQSNAERAEYSDAVFVATIEFVGNTQLRTPNNHPLRKASVRVEHVQKQHELLKERPLSLFFEEPRNPGPDRGWVGLVVGQRAVFYTRIRSLKTGETVLFLDFQSDAQVP